MIFIFSLNLLNLNRIIGLCAKVKISKTLSIHVKESVFVIGAICSESKRKCFCWALIWKTLTVKINSLITNFNIVTERYKQMPRVIMPRVTIHKNQLVQVSGKWLSSPNIPINCTFYSLTLSTSSGFWALDRMNINAKKKKNQILKEYY